MVQRTAVFFEEAGARNTNETVRLAAERVKELGIKQVIVASGSGLCGVKMMDALKGYNAKLVVVGGAMGENLKKLQANNVPVVKGTHALSAVERSIRRIYGGISPAELIAATLKKFFSQGMKVVVEIAIMAADAQEIKISEDAVVLGGTIRGADTAVVLKPATYGNMFDLKHGIKIKEIICMPRERSPLEAATTLA